jgi:hypothetical protein
MELNLKDRPLTLPFRDVNHILQGRSRHHYWRGIGSLSIKSFGDGRALYDTGAGRYAVDERAYLVLNHGQEYSITIDSRTPVDSFCVFFRQGLAEEVQRSLFSSDTALLDDPEARAPPVEFFAKTYARAARSTAACI